MVILLPEPGFLSTEAWETLLVKMQRRPQSCLRPLSPCHTQHSTTGLHFHCSAFLPHKYISKVCKVSRWDVGVGGEEIQVGWLFAFFSFRFLLFILSCILRTYVLLYWKGPPASHVCYTKEMEKEKSYIKLELRKAGKVKETRQKPADYITKRERSSRRVNTYQATLQEHIGRRS